MQNNLAYYIFLYRIVCFWDHNVYSCLFIVQIFWNAGCQLVALNYQTSGKWCSPLRKKKAKNGDCVCVLPLIFMVKAKWFFPEFVENTKLIDCLGFNVFKLLNKMLSILSVTLTVILRVGLSEHNRDLLHFISKILMVKVKVTKAYLFPSKVIVVIRILIARFWLYKSEIPTFFITIFVF